MSIAISKKVVLSRPGVKVIVNMPPAYTQDLRSRAIWLTEIVDFAEVNEVSLSQMSKKTISRYVRKFRMLGHVYIKSEISGIRCA